MLPPPVWLRCRSLLLPGGLLLSSLWPARGEAPSLPLPDFAEYRTVATAIPAPPRSESPRNEGVAGYLGISVSPGADGRLVVGEVALDSPGLQAGVRRGDFLLALSGKPVGTVEEVRSRVQAGTPGETVVVRIERAGEVQELSASLGAISRPLRLSVQHAIIGVRMGPGTEAAGIPIQAVTKDKPAAKAGLQPGDLLLRADGRDLSQEMQLANVLAERKAGDHVRLLVRRGAEEFEREVELIEDENAAYVPPGESRTLNTWKKEVFRLAVIGIEFTDRGHSEKIAAADWMAAFFSRGSYTAKSATGEPVFGSIADYYAETSVGRLRMEGKFFDWVPTGKNRSEFDVGSTTKARTDLLDSVVEAVLAREGADALRDFDGLAFVYAGERFATANRGSLLWPHRAAFRRQGKLWPYVIAPETGVRGGMSTISTWCHELGHILGLPDLYARPENPGSEGAGLWCVMSSQVMNGRPQHFCAWSKEQLGWLEPVPIDPAVPQKLLLSPVEGSSHECFKVLLRPDGSEYLLLENRRRTGFDASLPAEGLLIWRVVGNRPILEESHGISGPPGPRVYLRSVPFPSHSNDAFTPWTTPSSRSQLAGGAPVFITNIRQWPDGRVSFQIGYEYE